jgi:hypothetical protein
MEYYDSGWDALATLSWDTTTDQPSTWLAEYWNTPGATSAPPFPTGAPVVTRQESDVNHQWFQASPAPGVNADHFVARWTRSMALTAGTYAFSVTADDGVRLYVDGSLVIDHWADQGATTYTANVPLSAGTHTVVMQYYENAWDATAKLSWAATTAPPTTWLAEYWNTPGATSAPPFPTGAPVVSRQETAVDHDWWQASPAPGINADHFVARWTRSMALTAGTYTFTVRADDGVRLYVDGKLVIDHWVDQSATTYTANVPLSAGTHTVVMQYYENAWDATAHLTVTNPA